MYRQKQTVMETLFRFHRGGLAESLAIKEVAFIVLAKIPADCYTVACNTQTVICVPYFRLSNDISDAREAIHRHILSPSFLILCVGLDKVSVRVTKLPLPELRH